jgi:broad specificity phosphatase PhoE
VIARIVLVRHGRSAHVHAGWIDSDGVRRWREQYDAAGIAVESEPPPPALRALAERADVVVSSDLPRAVASAKAIAPAREVPASPLLREWELDIPRCGGVRLPLTAWGLLVYGQWKLSERRGEPFPEPVLRQAADAAAWLESLAGDGRSVVAVTHGAVRTLVARELERRGWAPGPAKRRFSHWSGWELERR